MKQISKLTDSTDRYQLFHAIPFILFHLCVLGVFWSGVTTESVIICIVLYVIRMWAITAGYHRYFSHKTFNTSRVFQFILAFLAQTSAQQGVIWWANHHRLHHQYSDTQEDVHSPRQRGFWFSHVGWIFVDKYVSREYTTVKEWQRFPELVWLDKHRYVPATILGIAVFLLAGWPGLFVGFFLSTILTFHCTFFINSLAHVFGRQRYVTADDSRNSWFLAMLTLGEGWHNNHHHFATSVKQGFFWWEIDITYYILWILSKMGIVWNLQLPPKEVVMGTQQLPARIVARSTTFFDKINVDGLVSKMKETANSIAVFVEQPSLKLSQRNKELKLVISQMKQAIAEKTKQLEDLPPKLNAIFKSKLQQASDVLEKALLSIEIKQHLLQSAAMLQQLAHRLQCSHCLCDQNCNQVVALTPIKTTTPLK